MFEIRIHRPFSYKCCKEKHFSNWQGIAMAERFSGSFIQIAVAEEYCHVCNKVRREYMIFLNIPLKKYRQKV